MVWQSLIGAPVPAEACANRGAAALLKLALMGLSPIVFMLHRRLMEAEPAPGFAPLID